ncbi:MAG: HEAT repeat domain-containing protein [Myxococcales bacterium]|nr:HEAT repeat domain-containing protein [Myxococcales bacterium]
MVIAFLTLASQAFAESAPATWYRHARLHQTAPPVSIRVQPTDEGVALLADSARLDLPLTHPRSISVRSFRLGKADDAYVAVVRVKSEEMRYAALLVAPEGRADWLWSGREDLHGDPGERIAQAVTIRKQGPLARVTVSEARERVRVCGQPLAAIEPQYLDPQTMSLRAVVLPRIPQALRNAAILVKPLAERPDEFPDMPKVALLSRNRALRYPEDFVTWSWESQSWPLEALRIQMGSPASVPGRLLLIGNTGVPLAVTLPPDTQGGAIWVRFSKPKMWRCVSVVREDGSLVLSQMELSGYSELDRKNGLEQLLSRWRQGGEAQDEATSLLKHWGTEAVLRLHHNYGSLGALSRRGAVSIFASYAPRTPVALLALGRAAQDRDAVTRQAAVKALMAIGDEALGELDTISLYPSREGDHVARWMAEHHPENALPTLLKALGRRGGTERAALREALRATVSHLGTDRGDGALVKWWSSKPTVGARAGAILALSPISAERNRMADWLKQTVTEARSFEARWRLVLAAALLPPDTVIDRWLVHMFEHAAPWMLREQALYALSQRQSAAAPKIALLAVRDRYPLVRAHAIAALTAHRQAAAWPFIAQRLSDPAEWPLVQAAAVHFVTALCLHKAAKVALMPLFRTHPARYRWLLRELAHKPTSCQIPGNL